MKEFFPKGDGYEIYPGQAKERVVGFSSRPGVILTRYERSAMLRVHNVCDVFCLKMGLDTEKYLPKIKITSEPGIGGAHIDGIIELSESKVTDMETIAEEVAHFFRDRLLKRRKVPFIHTALTHEFFGALGYRIYYESKTPLERERFHLQKPSESDFQKLRQDILKSAKRFHKLKAEINSLTGGKIGDIVALNANPRTKALLAEFLKLKESRRLNLTHFRAQVYASQIDLTKISDLRKFFSMPVREVRMRFFRSRPIYGSYKVPRMPKKLLLAIKSRSIKKMKKN